MKNKLFVPLHITSYGLITMGVLLCIFFSWPINRAQAASLYIGAAQGSFNVGKTFTISVLVSSDQSMNSAAGVVQFPSSLLEVASVSKAGSIITLWPEEPAFSNTNGTVSFAGTLFNPGFTGRAGKIISIVFKAKTAGQANISISGGQVLANDGKATNIFTGSTAASVTLIDQKSTAVLPKPTNQIPKPKPSQPKVTTITPTPTSASLNISVIPDSALVNGYKEFLVDDESVKVPVFTTNRPRFAGKTSIDRADITFDIQGDIPIHGTTYVTDPSGAFILRLPELSHSGLYALTVGAKSGHSAERSDTVTLNFYLDFDERALPHTLRPTTDDLANVTLFDVTARVPEELKHRAPGEPLFVNIQLTNFAADGQTIDVPLQYTIETEDGKKVLEHLETVAISTQLGLFKTITLPRDLKPGLYSVVIKVPSRTELAVSSDTFTVDDATLLTETAADADPSTLVFQLLGGLLLLFGLISYMEFNRALTRNLKKIDENDLRKL